MATQGGDAGSQHRDTERMIVLEGVGKHFGAAVVLRDLALQVTAGEFVAICGPSGAGKTTLLSIIGLLEQPSSGIYWLKGQPVLQLGDAQLSALRNRTFGYVFQNFSLAPRLTAWQNVARPLMYAGVARHERKARACKLLTQFGLADKLQLRPHQLSGGEQQRVAIARALVNNPEVILADEPTGNLPEEQWAPVFDILSQLNREGKTIIIITHNPEVASRAERVLELRSGVLRPLSEQHDGVLPQAELALRFLGGVEVRYQGQPCTVTPRQVDILALLAAHSEGLSGDELLLLLYGEQGNSSTLKAAVSRLRQQIPIGSQPYHLTADTQADFVLLERALRDGNLQEALNLYQGPLLPRSDAPGVITLRETLDSGLKQSVMATGTIEDLLRLAERQEDDLELWELALERLFEDDGRRGLVIARIDAIRKSWEL